MAYTVFETTNMQAVRFGERIFDCILDEPVENGTFGHFEGLQDGYTHVYKFVKGTKKGYPTVVANMPAWDEDTRLRTNQLRENYIIPANTPFRAYVLHLDDEFAISIDGVTPGTRTAVTGVTDFAKNNIYLTVDATGKLAATTEAPAEGEQLMVGHIERKRKISGTLVTGVRTYGREGALYEVRVTTLA